MLGVAGAEPAQPVAIGDVQVERDSSPPRSAPSQRAIGRGVDARMEMRRGRIARVARHRLAEPGDLFPASSRLLLDFMIADGDGESATLILISVKCRGRPNCRNGFFSGECYPCRQLRTHGRSHGSSATTFTIRISRCCARHARRGIAASAARSIRSNWSLWPRPRRSRQIDAGAELVGDAEAVDSYSNVLSGVVKLTKTLSDGRQQIVGLQFAPDFLGRPFKAESAHQRGSRHRCFAVLVSEGGHRADDRGSRPELEHRLLQADAEGTRRGARLDGDARAQDRGRKSRELPAADRPQHRSDRAIRRPQRLGFDLPLTRADIADFLGLTIETVSRQLTKLRADGVIRIENNRHVTVDNMARLGRRSGAWHVGHACRTVLRSYRR